MHSYEIALILRLKSKVPFPSDSLEQSAEQKVRKFGHNKPIGESGPGVDLCHLFSLLEDVSTANEKRLDLRNDSRGALRITVRFGRSGSSADLHKDKAEDTEYLELKIRSAVSDHPVGESVKQSGEDV
jgi:hypothetical protein